MFRPGPPPRRSAGRAARVSAWRGRAYADRISPFRIVKLTDGPCLCDNYLSARAKLSRRTAMKSATIDAETAIIQMLRRGATRREAIGWLAGAGMGLATAGTFVT